MKRFCEMVAVAAVVLCVCTSAIHAATVIGGDYRLGESDAGAANGLAGAAATVNNGVTAGADLAKVILSGTGPVYTSSVAASAAAAGNTLAMQLGGTGYYLGASPAQAYDQAIEGWFKVDSNLSQNQALAYNGDSYNNGVGLYLIGGHVQGIGGGGGFGLLDSGFTPTPGEWFYAAVSVGDGTASVYINSRTATAMKAGTILASPVANQFTIGTAGNSTNGFGDLLSGAADQVRVHAYGYGYAFDPSTDLSYVAVPEPMGICMLLSGLVGIMAYAWRKRR